MAMGVKRKEKCLPIGGIREGFLKNLWIFKDGQGGICKD